MKTRHMFQEGENSVFVQPMIFLGFNIWISSWDGEEYACGYEIISKICPSLPEQTFNSKIM